MLFTLTYLLFMGPTRISPKKKYPSLLFHLEFSVKVLVKKTVYQENGIIFESVWIELIFIEIKN